MHHNIIIHPAWIEVDLSQLRLNIASVRGLIGKSLYCFPVKANAYGHGLCQVGKAAEACGVDYLGVAHLQEGVKLRQAGVKIPILVLGAIHEDQIDELIEHALEFTISSQYKAELVAKKAQGQKCRVHLEVDTGMQRTGVRCSTAKTVFSYLKTVRGVEVVGIYSHLATADENGNLHAVKQLDSFLALCNDPIFQGSRLIRHLANSSGTLNFPQSYLDMVRPSFLTLGYGPHVSPCFSLKAKVSYFKIVEAGQGIGYGHTYITPQQTRIVTIPVGYGDGYRRSLSNRGSVIIRGKRFPIRGTICMDQFMVDVGDHEVRVGDEAVLLGKQGQEEITLREIADLCDTIPYEILCMFNERIPRVYIQTS